MDKETTFALSLGSLIFGFILMFISVSNMIQASKDVISAENIGREFNVHLAKVRKDLVGHIHNDEGEALFPTLRVEGYSQNGIFFGREN